MKYLVYSAQENTQYKYCILVNNIKKDEIEKAYITPFGINPDDVLVLDLHQAPGKKKTPVKEIKQYIEEELMPVLNDMCVEYIICGDAEYFKVLSKNQKADALVGYVLDNIYGKQKVL